ncbi:MAG: CoA-binding protein [Dehalococcoidia bacterium]|nr:CoA-binding protein [Dehalococcoidia bacterium]
MAIFVDKDTNVLIQGITGRLAAVQTKIMLDYETKIVAGVTPGKGGQTQFGIPVYDSVQQAASKHRIDASVIYVPAPFVQDAAFEAIDAGIKFMVIVTDWVPLHSEIKIKAYAKHKGTRYIGPNTMGMMVPGQTSLGGVLAPGVKPGGIAIVCRSGALSNEIPSRLAEQGVKLSVVIGLGGDPVVGSRMIDVLKLLKEDEQTKGVLLVGEIGGTMEEEAAEYIKTHFNKQVVAFIAGRTAPRGKTMGHAGAMIMSGRGTAESKIKAFQLAGVPVAKTLLEIPSLVKQMT